MSFSELPPELVLSIASYLDVQDLASLSSVNKRLSAIAENAWQTLFKLHGFVTVPFIEKRIRGNSNLNNSYNS
jgi:hypothetical protein